MINEFYKDLTGKGSVIRQFFDYANKKGAEIGMENIYNFSIGNPSVPVPQAFTNRMIELLQTEDPVKLHSYSPSLGLPSTRQAVADSLNKRFGMNYTMDHIFMTSAAASALAHALRCVTKDGDEVITFAPYFPEYVPYVTGTGAKLTVIPADITTFQINFEEFEKSLNPNVQAILINSPNNPSGIVYSTATITKLADILRAKEKEYGHPIYLISDEPYRELAYDGVEVPYLTKYYDNTVVGYSYSKSLSLPGERIGYLVIPDEADGSEALITAAAIANRTIGCVNAPSLMQKVIAKCVDAEVDVAAYDKNRLALYNGLKECGFECIKPQGAFYLFVKSPVADEKAFCEAGKKYNILMVPGSSFACPGYVRLAYCVSYDTIINSLPEFKKLAEEFGL